MLSSFKSYKIEKIPTAKDLVSSQETTLPFTFPVDLQKHFPHGFLDAQIGVDKSVFQEQSTLGTEYEAVNTTVNELEKKKSEANILKEKLMELFGRKNLKPFQDNQRALFSDKIAELKKEVNLLKEKIKGINLENSLLAYERGMALLGHCQETLGQAEQKIRVLEAGILRDFTDSTGASEDVRS
jgi:exodeoxyribonuclease VII small subunit